MTATYPFNPAADAAAYVARTSTESALDDLELALYGDSIAVALLGPAGIGKTLLLHVLAQRLVGDFLPIYLPYPLVGPDELCRWVLSALEHPAGADPEATLLVLARKQASQERPLLLLIDDVDALPLQSARSVLELARNSSGGLHLTFAGMDSARAARVLELMRPDVEITRLDEPLSESETAHYIETRLHQVNASEETRSLFDADAVAQIHARSGGIPACIHEEAVAVLRQVWPELPAVAPPSPSIATFSPSAEEAAAESDIASEAWEAIPDHAEPEEQSEAEAFPSDEAWPDEEEALADTAPLSPQTTRPAPAPESDEDTTLPMMRFEISSLAPEESPFDEVSQELSPPAIEAGETWEPAEEAEPEWETEEAAVEPAWETAETAEIEEDREAESKPAAAPSRATAESPASKPKLEAAYPDLVAPPKPPTSIQTLLSRLTERWTQRRKPAVAAATEPTVERTPLRQRIGISRRGSALAATFLCGIGVGIGIDRLLLQRTPAAPQTSRVAPAPTTTVPEALPQPEAETQPETTAPAPPSPEAAAVPTLSESEVEKLQPELIVLPQESDFSEGRAGAPTHTAAVAPRAAPLAKPAPRATTAPASQKTKSAAVPPPSVPSASGGKAMHLVNVNARPWATIQIDGVDFGETPLGDLKLSEGPHRIVARMSDGRVVERTVEVNADTKRIVFR